MKKLLFLLTFHLSLLTCMAQQDAHGRDSLANSAGFQLKVRESALTTSYAVVAGADTSTDQLVVRYAQLWIREPQGAQITAMSYGVMNDKSIDSSSTQDEIQAVVGNTYVTQAYAWYQTPPPSTQAARVIMQRFIKQAIKREDKKP